MRKTTEPYNCGTRRKSVPDKPDTWSWLSDLLQTYWPAVYAAILSFLIASFRIIYEGGKLRQVAIEAPLLGLLALAFSNALSLVGVSQDVAPFFGGMVGFIGVESTRELAIRLLKRGAKTDDNSENG